MRGATGLLDLLSHAACQCRVASVNDDGGTFPREAFIPAANEDFQPIEETAKELGLIE